MDRVADALRSFATLDRAARGDEARITDALRDAVARLAAALDLTALLVVSVDNRYGGRVRLLAVRSSDDAAPGANGSSLRRFEDEAIPEAAYGIQVVAEAAGADVGRTALLLDPMQPEPATEPRPGAPLLVALHRAGPTTAAPVAGDLERAATLLWLALDRLDSPLVAADAGPDRETAARIADDNVAFTVYRPRALPAGTWTTVLAFAHLTEAPAGDSDPVAAVRDQAARLLGPD